MRNLYKFDSQRQRQGIFLRHHPGKQKNKTKTKQNSKHRLCVNPMMNIYLLWYEVFSLENLKNIQYFKHWITSEVVEVKNDKIFNFKNSIREDQTMKIKNH